MADHWKRSRVTKVLTDAGRAQSFEEAEARLDKIQVEVVVGVDQSHTAAGQAAALTAVVTAKKCFGRVRLVAPDVPLIARLPLGDCLLKAARKLGAETATEAGAPATHTICIGDRPATEGWNVYCWWDRWKSGTRAYENKNGDSRLALSGIYAAALAVRQIFACALAARTMPARDISVSLWTPWRRADEIDRGPERFDVPDKLWLIGLGHLGQAFVWNLCFLPVTGDRHATLQDDQSIAEENEATSLLVLPGGDELGQKKVRIAVPWLELSGWDTALIERRHHGDMALTADDPLYLLCGLDRIEPRLLLAKHGFPYMVDAGVGHGAGDFEKIQIRTIANGRPLDGLWERKRLEECDCSRATKLFERPAYRDLERRVGECGKVRFGEASVGVPFVGAATGAIAIAQLARLASLNETPLLMQMELSAPEMTTIGGLGPAPQSNLGSNSIRL
jgi:hypothetical protein